MNKLLRANFRRLWRSKIFWIGMLFTTGVGLISSMTQYREMKTIADYHPHIDNILFSNSLLMPLVAAVFIGLFVGTEYNDGTMRNKLIIGHSRGAVYFSNLIVCTAALLLMHLMDIGVIVAVGFPLVGNIEMPVSGLVVLGLISLVTVMALSAVFLMISMLVHSKAYGSVGAIILAIVFLIGAMMIDSRLQEPEYYEPVALSYSGDTDTMFYSGAGVEEKNPNYLDGAKREIYEFLYDFLPGCQMLQITKQSLQHPVRLSLYSVSIIIVTAACGTFFFRKKNIK